MGARGSYAANDFPCEAEHSQLGDRDLCLEARKEFVLLVAHVLTEYLDEAVEYGLPLDGVGVQALEARHQFVDLLMLALDLQSEFLAVFQDPAHNRPEHRFFCERMRKHQTINVQEHTVLLVRRRGAEPFQETVEGDVIVPLSSKNADAPAQLRNALVCD
ncbi:hypothetical protein L1277_000801 [Okibacterium sp. HSC-33S16]|nr:hypothetical protein [Okibacterium sp. HSC-33S16]